MPSLLWVSLSNSPRHFSIDSEDYDLINQYRWRLHEGYVISDFYDAGKKHRLFVHRVILKLKHGDPNVDHRDGNPLNNQKYNLKLADQTWNGLNHNVLNFEGTSKYRGVSWNKSKQKWQARRQAYGRKYHVGYFATEQEAADSLVKWSKDRNLPVGYK